MLNKSPLDFMKIKLIGIMDYVEYVPEMLEKNM